MSKMKSMTALVAVSLACSLMADEVVPSTAEQGSSVQIEEKDDMIGIVAQGGAGAYLPVSGKQHAAAMLSGFVGWPIHTAEADGCWVVHFRDAIGVRVKHHNANVMTYHVGKLFNLYRSDRVGCYLLPGVGLAMASREAFNRGHVRYADSWMFGGGMTYAFSEHLELYGQVDVGYQGLFSSKRAGDVVFGVTGGIRTTF